MAEFKFMAECGFCKRQFSCYTKNQAESILRSHSATHLEEAEAEYKVFESRIFKEQITDKGLGNNKAALKSFWENDQKLGLVGWITYFETKSKGKILEIKNELGK